MAFVSHYNREDMSRKLLEIEHDPDIIGWLNAGCEADTGLPAGGLAVPVTQISTLFEGEFADGQALLRAFPRIFFGSLNGCQVKFQKSLYVLVAKAVTSAAPARRN